MLFNIKEWQDKHLILESELKFDFGKDTLGDQVRAQLDTMKQNPRKAVEKFTQDLIAASKSGKFKWKTNHPSTNYSFLKGVGKLFRIQGIKSPKFADVVFNKIKAAVGEGKR
jgi:hypothetical protein